MFLKWLYGRTIAHQFKSKGEENKDEHVGKMDIL